jgi:hypothetical protein
LQRATDSNRNPERTICLANSATPCMDYSLFCSPCWIRTNTILFLRQVPLPIGLRGYLWGMTESNRLSFKHLIYSQTRYQLRNTSPCFLSGGNRTRTYIFGFSDQRLDHLGYSSKILRRQRESNPQYLRITCFQDKPLVHSDYLQLYRQQDSNLHVPPYESGILPIRLWRQLLFTFFQNLI